MYKIEYSLADAASEIDGAYERTWMKKDIKQVKRMVNQFKRDHPNSHVADILRNGVKIGESIQWYGKDYGIILDWTEVDGA